MTDLVMMFVASLMMPILAGGVVAALVSGASTRRAIFGLAVDALVAATWVLWWPTFAKWIQPQPSGGAVWEVSKK
ncbi:hypothetical protein BWI17_00635 [Betaproteobacteria bacterium GR16-43]|nr:hypothetical protein BWI17_00635 [Betaproteobacteria bacterium GR16-43]